MKKRYYIATPITSGNFAGTKAREDIETLADRHGMQRIEFFGDTTANRNFLKRIGLVLLGLRNWVRLEQIVEPGSVVLFQYPHYPMKSAALALMMLRRMQRCKQIRFLALIHDLNSVRSTFGKAAAFSDSRFLKAFDFVICHNERMREHLIQRGFDSQRLIALGVFDYLAEGAIPPGAPFTPSVNIAGNLSREKSGYLYDLLRNDPGYRLYLYGAGLEIAPSGTFVQYEGYTPAELLPEKLKGAFGLVWDGACADTCTGEYGAYLAINNPHKLSLYLCAGRPVIIWRGAALKDYVEQYALGFCVSSLSEINSRLTQMDVETYRSMQRNAAREGAKIRDGFYFHQAISQLEERCFEN